MTVFPVVLLVSLLTFLHYVAAQMRGPILPLYAAAHGATPTWVGFIIGAHMTAAAAGSIPLGRASDVWGRRPFLLGGMAVGVGMLDLGVVEYYVRTAGAISIADCVAGLIKASVFGVLVAVAGCLRGIQCGRSSAAVGAATTSAVVTGIVLIIVSDALTTVLFDLLGL